MKVAIPTNDMTTISTHFGRTKGFMVYDIDKNNISFNQYSLNTFTRHAKGDYEEHGSHDHNHDGIFTAIGKCQVVIAGGMGKHLYDEFNQKGIQVFITEEKNIHKAIELLTKSELDNNTAKVCEH